VIGFVNLAMRLAESRAATGRLVGYWTVYKLAPTSRDSALPDIHPISTEYYRIIDRVARGERP
jgi:hypothetical protein